MIDQPAVPGIEDAHTDAKEHSQRRSQHGTPEPLEPARLRLCHFFTQPSLQAHVEIRRWFWNLPLIEQRHRCAHRFQFLRTSVTTFQMPALVRRRLVESSYQVGHPFTNFITFHDYFPLTHFANATHKEKQS